MNASDAEIERITVPDLHETVWADRESLGWRDPSGSPRGYIVHWVDDRLVGIMVRAAGSPLRPGIGAMCSLCRTPQPSTQKGRPPKGPPRQFRCDYGRSTASMT